MPAIWIPKRLVETSLINTAAESAKSFVSHCEIEYESRVYAAAGEVLASGCHVVMLTGPSASGKTTSAHKLAAALERRSCPAQVVSLDNFYLNLNDYPRLPDGSKDYENITALDIPAIHTVLSQLLTRGEAELPVFDFTTEYRKPETEHINLNGGVCVVEGIHALNPILTETLPRDKVYKIYAGLREEYSHKGQRVLPTRDIRLARRMVRDYKYRGHSLEKTLGMWSSVCAGEDRFIKPFKVEADLLLDTSFSYEPCLLAGEIAPLAGRLPDDSPLAEMLNSLAGRFALCDPLSLDLVPADSMLREFLG